MIYATHQADAYATPEELDAAVVARAGSFLRCTWKGGAIANVADHMAADLAMGGTHGIASVDRERGRVTLTTGYEISANGYCQKL